MRHARRSMRRFLRARPGGDSRGPGSGRAAPPPQVYHRRRNQRRDAASVDGEHLKKLDARRQPRYLRDRAADRRKRHECVEHAKLEGGRVRHRRAQAFLDAFHKARPIVLEPIAHVEVTAPEPSMGAITSDFSSKRGRISGSEVLANGMVTISAEVPLAELEHYEMEMKSLPGGEGSYTMEPTHYEPAPAHVQEKIVAEHQPRGSGTG